MRNRLSILGVAAVLAMFAASFGLAGSGPAAVRASTTLDVCGSVTVYVRATADAAGTVTVGGDPFVIAAGAHVDPELDAGADLCLQLTINTFGAVTELVVVDADANAHLRICGVISAYVQATGQRTGRITIGDRDLVIAAGADLPASIKVGADLCANFELNAQGQVKGGTVRVHGDSTIHVCGVVNALTEATANSTGTLKIGNHDLVIAAGADLPAKVDVGARICADLKLNVNGQVTSCDNVVIVPGPEPPGAGPKPTPGEGPNPTQAPGGGPSPTHVPGGGAGPGGTGGETCPDGSSAEGAFSASATLSADASLGERAAALAATSAIPFGMFLLGIVAAGALSRWRRPNPTALTDEDGSEQ